jgi:hypothetical protein
MKRLKTNKWFSILVVLTFGTMLAVAVCCTDSSTQCPTPTLVGVCPDCGAGVSCIPAYSPSYRDVVGAAFGGNPKRVATYTCEWNCGSYCANCDAQFNIQDTADKEEFRAEGTCPGG